MTGRWLVWILVAVLWGVGCFFLGQWQWNRWDSKHSAQQEVSRNYDAQPRAFSALAPARGAQLPKNREWSQVRLTGRYLPRSTVLVRNRPANGNFGYEVLVPFAQANGGGTVLVDRGWVDNGVNASTPAPVPPAPAGPSTVIGWLRPTEPTLDRAPVRGSVASINPADVTAQTKVATYPNVYVRMRSERTATGVVPAAPAPLDKPNPGSYAGINLSYALQWWLAMVAGLAFVLLRARREHRDSLIESGELPPDARRAKKVRIWDEEDE